MFHVWDYYSSNYEVMFIQLYWIKDKLYANIHFYEKKKEATYKFKMLEHVETKT